MGKRRKDRPRLVGSDAAIAYLFAGLSGLRSEMLCVAYLDSERAIMGLRLSYARRAEGIDLPVRRIVEDAIGLNSAGLILAHNHPSGTAMPSDADIAATRTLAHIAHPLGLRLHDHLIFGHRDCCSFRALGLL